MFVHKILPILKLELQDAATIQNDRPHRDSLNWEWEPHIEQHLSKRRTSEASWI
jgi:hypothetical protein